MKNDIFCSEPRALTDSMLWSLATMKTNSGPLKTTALKWLRMDDHIVETELYNHPRGITSAAHAVLKC